MVWWSNRQDRAAKAYAAQLPAWLVKGFGAAEFYTPAQIRAGIRVLKLDDRHSDLAFAAFLSKADYEVLAIDQPEALTYEDARERFLRWKPAATGEWAPLTSGTLDG